MVLWHQQEGAKIIGENLCPSQFLSCSGLFQGTWGGTAPGQAGGEVGGCECPGRELPGPTVLDGNYPFVLMLKLSARKKLRL